MAEVLTIYGEEDMPKCDFIATSCGAHDEVTNAGEVVRLLRANMLLVEYRAIAAARATGAVES